MFKYGVISLIVVLFITGCSQGSAESQRVDIAKQYLEEKGYTMIEHIMTVEPFILTESDLLETYHIQIWQLQMLDVEQYIGKMINGEVFLINNHPLDHYENGTIKGLGYTHVHLLIVDDVVIGGTASPVTEETIFGAPYSLEGKTFEDLYPNENWREWTDKWIEKYTK
ncbi:hypothetical protein [Evansella cellulosilytica]|uniref:Lipoprotein n=1 Tax=Evansella cellulosilytica (strain ATCC 21833 / DSM 2522 / FERM P-1141 / JCM 9156 / N-4) TaxID=649639 RepID=E6TXE1_EVAC2|nr:hypothetical protein [Evansella cellulosilytica]ADU32336.1 hypothetical protein Bcell_4108 [Evansella cellulosilytica DSM 2522]